MKKLILIITSRSQKTTSWKEREAYVREFCDNLERQLSNVSVRFTTYDDLEFTIIKGQASVYDTRNALDIKDVNLVHFKNWTYETEEASTLALILKEHNIPFFNAEVYTSSAAGKLLQMFCLNTAGVAVPDTFYARKPLLKKIFESGKLPKGFSLPIIMKAKGGSRGDDNYLIKSLNKGIGVIEKTNDPDKEYILQNYIPNDGDYRFLFVGLDMHPLVFHRRAVSGTHLNNTSKGGAGNFVEVSTLPDTYLRYALQSARTLGREIGGVDIIVDKNTDEPYVLEVNGTPALATGYGVEVKTAKFAEFVQTLLDAQEEE